MVILFAWKKGNRGDFLLQKGTAALCVFLQTPKGLPKKGMQDCRTRGKDSGSKKGKMWKNGGGLTTLSE